MPSPGELSTRYHIGLGPETKPCFAEISFNVIVLDNNEPLI